MPAITFSNDEDSWVVARWVFCGYLEHVHGEISYDSDLAQIVEEAMALDGLHFSLIERNIAERLAPVLLRVANEVVAGKRAARVEGRVLDTKSQAQFQEAVADLRAKLWRKLTGLNDPEPG